MTRLDSISAPTELNLIVSFSSLAGFNKRFVLPGQDRHVFDTMRDYYAWSGELIQKSGGNVIKCIGDALMLAFDAEKASAAVMALRELKSSGDRWLKERQVPCHHYIKAHLGSVIAGPIGAPGMQRVDLYGKTVNICATLESQGLAITPQVFRALDSETRKFFKKHTPPMTYIRAEDTH
jgi:class 3 adenylate cyclase